MGDFYKAGYKKKPALPDGLIGKAIEELTEMPIAHKHVQQLAKLPTHHSNPFDRIMVAQARSSDFYFMTRDTQILRYDVKIIQV
jgi:PIN domain nuclease of toxin-antitoxin system